MSAGRNDLLEALTLICKAGVKLIVEPDGPFDWHHTLTPKGAIEYAADPDGLIAEHYGVSVEELNAWRRAGGYLRCHAMTSKRKRCKLPAAGFSFEMGEAIRNPREWVLKERLCLYCPQHARAVQRRPS